MAEGLEQRYKKLADLVDGANSLGYRPHREATIAMDSALGGKPVVRAFVSLKKADEGRAVTGMMLLIGENLVARVLLKRVTVPRVEQPERGILSVTTVRRSALRYFHVDIPAHEIRRDWSEPSGFTPDSTIEVEYEGIRGEMKFELDKFGAEERGQVVQDFVSDLARVN